MTTNPIDSSEKQSRLRAIGADTAAVYIHIPFCHHRCSYCDFNIYAGMKALHTPYVETVIREIEIAATRLRGGRVPSIYVGGGTPSLLPPHLIERLLTAVRTCFDVDPEAEITLEANPGEVPADYFARLRSAGVNRLSLGVQASHADELQLLRRGHSFQAARAAYEAARRAGFDNINVDLIYGLPAQSIERWRETLERVIDLRPDHLSAYSLQVEERTAMLRWIQTGRVSAPREDDVADMYELAQDLLAQAGFTHYEISNWARSADRASRHNLVYWRNKPYFGFGCGAHSYYAGRRYSNALHPRGYIERIQQTGEALAEAEQIDRALEMGETLMLGLRLIEEGVERARFADRFGVELDAVYGVIIQRLSDQGLIENSAERVRLTPRGRLLGNRVFGEFLPAAS